MVIGSPNMRAESLSEVPLVNSPEEKKEKEESLYMKFQKWMDLSENTNMLLAAKHKVEKEEDKLGKEEVLIEELENLYYIFLKNMEGNNLDLTKETDDFRIILSINKKRTLLCNLEEKIMRAKSLIYKKKDEDDKKSPHYSKMFGTLNLSGKRMKDHEVTQPKLAPLEEKRKQGSATLE